MGEERYIIDREDVSFRLLLMQNGELTRLEAIEKILLILKAERSKLMDEQRRWQRRNKIEYDKLQAGKSRMIKYYIDIDDDGWQYRIYPHHHGVYKLEAIKSILHSLAENKAEVAAEENRWKSMRRREMTKARRK